ncbi:(2Fe-2S)-binding protein [Streptomyces sp. NRRL S-31]|uniref:(2Fe-2S)-binding protein n=1 Tax=Streptomyces sp. NRRL S-31 TaxID=1463898 RepID=UPI0004C594F5|nr:(2Fe-2S)-binding protein [Streptomyces sp. NRRL S-31]
MPLDPELAALRALGGFFVLRTHPDTAGGADPRSLPTLADGYGENGSDGSGSDGSDADGSGRGGCGTDGCGKGGAGLRRDPLAARVAVVGDRLRVAEPRVAASLAHQGLAARLWSVALGCAVLYGELPDLDPRLLRWDVAATAPDDLWLTVPRPLPANAANAATAADPGSPRNPVRNSGNPADADTLADAVLLGHLEPLTAALRARYGVAAGLLRGNAGSALAATARELGRWARARGRADVAARTRALTAGLFAHPLLRTTGVRTGTAFRRRSCCLYYRVPGGGLCGDCCLTRPPRSSPGAASG